MKGVIVDMIKNIIIAGVGGQGALLTSHLLGKIAISSGYEVKLSEVHGMAQRGGSVITFVRYGSNIAEPIVEEGEADILVAFEYLEALRYSHYLKADGIIILNEQRIDPMSVINDSQEYPQNEIEILKEEYEVHGINAIKEANRLGNYKVSNLIVLGVLAKYIDFSKEQWMTVIEKNVPKNTIEINKKAFMLGFENKE